MASLKSRNGRLYAKVKDIHGVWRRLRTDFVDGQEQQAQAWADARELEVKQELLRIAGGVPSKHTTVNEWAKTWGGLRRDNDLDSNNDYRRLELHVLPIIGDMPIRDVRTKHIIAVISAIRTKPIKTRNGLEAPAPRTVHNIYSALCALFRDAVFEELVDQDPCILTETQLGVKTDKDREWRETALFAREEVQTLISSTKIPWDRRVAYAIELLGALRPGETAALRWRHYDQAKTPLGGLLVATALDSKRGRAKGTKTETVKHVPVHPTLAAILGEWKLAGWAEMMGRPPLPDDLIVPLPPADAHARTRRRETEPFRTEYYAGRRWRDEDLPALGWRTRRHYDMRATFVTLILDDGADEHIIESRITHTKRPSGAFKLYNRGKQWALTCAELVKLKIVRVADDSTSEAIAAVAGDGFGPSMVQAQQLAAMTSDLLLRRRASNPTLQVLDGGRCEQDQQVTPPPDAPIITDPDSLDHDRGPSPKSACDLGFALLRASVVGSASYPLRTPAQWAGTQGDDR